MKCSICGREIQNDGCFDNGEGVCNVCLNQDSLGNDPCDWEELC